MKTLWQKYGQLAKYGLASLSSFALDAGCFYLFERFVFAGLGVWTDLACTVAARAISSFYNFNVNNRLVFGHRGDYGRAQAADGIEQGEERKQQKDGSEPLVGHPEDGDGRTGGIALRTHSLGHNKRVGSDGACQRLPTLVEEREGEEGMVAQLLGLQMTTEDTDSVCGKPIGRACQSCLREGASEIVGDARLSTIVAVDASPQRREGEHGGDQEGEVFVHEGLVDELTSWVLVDKLTS